LSLAIKYENPDDAKMRLRQTVVLYKGQPALIQDVIRGEGKDDILRVLFQELPTKGVGYIPGRLGDDPFKPPKEDAKRKYISSKHFDVAPFKMGYVNREDGTGAFFCSRLPNRIQKQGLCQENFKGTDNYGKPIPFTTFLTCKETPAMVAGRYPSFKEALEGLAKVPAVAFSTEFCLVKDPVIDNLVFLFRKGSKVGMYARNSGEVTLGKKFVCLKESLQELGLKVGVC
jgi:hypothetical protein